MSMAAGAREGRWLSGETSGSERVCAVSLWPISLRTNGGLERPDRIPHLVHCRVKALWNGCRGWRLDVLLPHDSDGLFLWCRVEQHGHIMPKDADQYLPHQRFRAISRSSCKDSP